MRLRASFGHVPGERLPVCLVGQPAEFLGQFLVEIDVVAEAHHLAVVRDVPDWAPATGHPPAASTSSARTGTERRGGSRRIPAPLRRILHGRIVPRLRHRVKPPRPKSPARYPDQDSYRQLNQSRARTTKKDVVYRLLLVGLGLLLRQAWVYLMAQVARARTLNPSAWVEQPPLTRLIEWLADALKARYKRSEEH